MHGGRRGTGSRLLHAKGLEARREAGGDHRGSFLRRRPSSRPGGFSGSRGCAVRFLHPRHGPCRQGASRKDAVALGPGDQRRAGVSPLPVHRIREDHRSGQDGRRIDEPGGPPCPFRPSSREDPRRLPSRYRRAPQGRGHPGICGRYLHRGHGIWGDRVERPSPWGDRLDRHWGGSAHGGSQEGPHRPRCARPEQVRPLSAGSARPRHGESEVPR